MSLCEQISTVSEYFLLRSYLSTHNVGFDQDIKNSKIKKFLDLVNRQNSSLIYFHIHIRVKLTLSQVSSSLVSRLCCSRINQTKGLHPSSISKILASDHPKIIAKLSQLTVKLLQGPDQVLGTCSESIGEQNLMRPSMLILRQTSSLVTRYGFPRIGY